MLHCRFLSAFHRVKLPPRFIVQRPVDKAVDNNVLEMHPEDLAALEVSVSIALHCVSALHHANAFCADCTHALFSLTPQLFEGDLVQVSAM